MSDLKPCPFCGNEAVICTKEGGVRCTKCTAFMHNSEVWNTRSPTVAMPELSQELLTIGEIARQEAETYDMVKAFSIGIEAIRKALSIEGE